MLLLLLLVLQAPILRNLVDLALDRDRLLHRDRKLRLGESGGGGSGRHELLLMQMVLMLSVIFVQASCGHQVL